ncbi:MAG: membrane dipeptidase [Lachnospiraceae bacterium]|nr:membrane dipeptidase [Lachnospiraceae bacterium]
MRIVDMHCDTISRLLEMREEGKEEGLYANGCHIDVEKMRKSGYLLQNFALFVDLAHCGDPWDMVQRLHRVYREQMEQNADWIAPVYRFDDIDKNSRAGKISALLTVEEGGVCGGETEKLRTLYEQGVRMLTLTWNYPNELGFPNIDSRRKAKLRKEAAARGGAQRDDLIREFLNTPDTEHGLTDTGFAFVAEMEKLGMIVDVSHLSDAGFYDVLRAAHKPFVASHSNARSVCPHVRNMSDDMIRALAERGGVMGLNFCADFLTQLPAGVHNPGTVQAIADHARHIVNTGGIECLGLGTDFDGIDTHEEVPDAGCMDRLFEQLKRSGFTESQIDRIFMENVLRLYREVLA